MIRCLVLAGQARMSGRQLPTEVDDVVQRVMDNAADNVAVKARSV